MSTTTTAPSPKRTAAADGARQRGILHGVTWLVWRQHRIPIIAGVVLLVAVAAAVAEQHSGMVTFIRTNHLAGCTASDSPPHCAAVAAKIREFSGLYESNFNHASALAEQIPLVIGVFFGAPLLARELESGTYRLIWTQSVTRTRWVLAKLCFPMALIAVATATLGLLWDWWWRAEGSLFNTVLWQDGVPFDLIGAAPVALSLLALTVGAALGLLLRRTVTAMLGTFVTTGLLEFAISQLRPYLGPTSMAVSRNPLVAPETSASAWVTQSGYVTSSGASLPDSTCSFQGENAPTGCYQAHGITGQFVRFHPAGQMWSLNWAEAGVCLAAAAALAAWMVWRVSRRPLV
ncbi:ABC transporter permease [Streptomyces sp. NPDC001307]|uniref:ABC transporter permease n=1 Tax=Streptomyces sp. NPDC001307 TaxID=3364560 RepID=UPI00368E9EA3